MPCVTSRRGSGTESPPLAQITGISVEALPVRGGTEFVILDSASGAGRTLISPDIGVCDDCLAELADPGRSPLPAPVHQLHQLRSALHDHHRPAVRPAVDHHGRSAAVRGVRGGVRRSRPTAGSTPRPSPARTAGRRSPCTSRASATSPATTRCAEARRLLSAGAIVAVKGLGGYHLACDATDETAVTTLRKRKDRGDKPFAIMVADLAVAEASGRDVRRRAGPAHRPAAPGGAARQRSLSLSKGLGRPSQASSPNRLPPSAPDSPDCGIMLPYTPVHRLLFGLPGDPPGPAALVLTSGNLAGEPIVTDDSDALIRLDGPRRRLAEPRPPDPRALRRLRAPHRRP